MSKWMEWQTFNVKSSMLWLLGNPTIHKVNEVALWIVTNLRPNLSLVTLATLMSRSCFFPNLPIRTTCKNWTRGKRNSKLDLFHRSIFKRGTSIKTVTIRKDSRWKLTFTTSFKCTKVIVKQMNPNLLWPWRIQPTTMNVVSRQI